MPSPSSTTYPFNPSGTTPAAPEVDPWKSPGQGQTLLEDKYAEPYQAYKQNPSLETSGPLLKAIEPIINESLRSYAGTEAQTGTARARAKVLALDAINRYDPQRAKLRTHLLSHLRGLRRVTERSTAGVYVPEQWRIDSRRVDAALNDARDELGREPSDAELAERAGIPIERIRKARQVPGVLSGSQFEGAIEMSNPSEKAWNSWVEGIYHDSDPKDQVILEYSLGLHGKPVLQANEVAAMLKLSPGAVSQRKARLQNALDEFELFMRGRGR